MAPEDREKLLNLPALQTPIGVDANSVNPTNLKTLELIIFQLCITTLVVFMRVYVKARVHCRLWIEDYLLITAWILFVGAFMPLVFLIEDLPIGVHQWNMSVRHMIKHLYYYFFAYIAYGLVVIPLKASLLLQILHIFVPHYSHRTASFWTIHFFLWLNVLAYAGLIIYEIFACTPVAKTWDVTIEGGHCTDRVLVHVTSTAINTGSDILLFVLPQPVIWRLNMSRSKRIGLSAVFLIAILACISSIIRLYHAIMMYSSDDVTYRAGLMGKWAPPELTCGFLALCLPIVPSFIKHVERQTRRFCSSTDPSDRRASRLPARGGGIADCPDDDTKTGPIITDVEFDELVRSSGESDCAASIGGDAGSQMSGRSLNVADVPKAV